MIILSEHDAFQRIIQGLAHAEDGAKMMAQHRPDVRDAWLMLSRTFGVCKESAWKLAEEAAAKTVKQ